jgi:hypothetical protein
VPANIFWPETANDQTELFVKPEFTSVQLVALLLRKIPPLLVPANTFEPETAREKTPPPLEGNISVGIHCADVLLLNVIVNRNKVRMIKCEEYCIVLLFNIISLNI